ncbi:hypothetical protein EDB19DRAFT_1755044, partial [Suillus lakei]
MFPVAIYPLVVFCFLNLRQVRALTRPSALSHSPLRSSPRYWASFPRASPTAATRSSRTPWKLSISLPYFPIVIRLLTDSILGVIGFLPRNTLFEHTLGGCSQWCAAPKALTPNLVLEWGSTVLQLMF